MTRAPLGLSRYSARTLAAVASAVLPGDGILRGQPMAKFANLLCGVPHGERRPMPEHVRGRGRAKLKVSQCWVGPVFVYMMHLLHRTQRPADMMFHHELMNSTISLLSREPNTRISVVPKDRLPKKHGNIGDSPYPILAPLRDVVHACTVAWTGGEGNDRDG